MIYGYYISADGAHAQDRRMDVIANNMANIETVGFKRQYAIMQARYAEDIQEGRQSPRTGSIDDVGGGVLCRGTMTDFSPGGVKVTETDTDLCIRGEGFFVVGRDGEQYLTRAGQFYVNADGEIRTQSGGHEYSLLSEDGVPLVLEDPTSSDWRFTPDGALMQGGLRQNIAMARPSRYTDLAKVGENLFASTEPWEPIPAEGRSIAVGCLETSGVNPTSELVSMIETSRAIEMNVRVMQTFDQMLGSLVSKYMRV